MKFLRKLLGKDREGREVERNESRIREIRQLGFDLIDRRGWVDGVYNPRRYFLERDGEVVSGPHSSYNDTINAARRLATTEKEPNSSPNETVS